MKPSVLACALVFSPQVIAAVSNVDLQAIQKLVAEEKYEEALQKHLWFHEESKSSTGMGGVRLSFALSQWVELGNKYPPALAALKELRDRHEKTLLEGKGSFPEFHEYFAINRTLKEQEKSYQLFKQLDEKFPDVAKRCFEPVADLIVAQGDYPLYGRYMDDPRGRYEKAEKMRELNLKMIVDNPQMDTPQFKQYTDNAFTNRTVQLIDVLTHLKRTDEAREIQKLALAYFPSPQIEAAMPAR